MYITSFFVCELIQANSIFLKLGVRDNIPKEREPTIVFPYQELVELVIGTLIPNTGFREIEKPNNR